MQLAMLRVFYLAIGMIVVSLVGLTVLHARYEAGLAPIPFIVWIYAPVALIALALHVVIRWDHLWKLFAIIAIAATTMLLALGGFRPAYWLAIVPASGVMAATIPIAWSNDVQRRS